MENHELLPLLSEAVSAGVFNGPIKTLEDIWDITLGIRIKSFADKKRANAEINLNAYKNELIKNMKTIPEERIKEPDLYIVGPALEASNFYIEEEELRKMFALLITNNMDTYHYLNVHPSFVEIIKQCSKLDALILKSVKNIFTKPLYSIRQEMPSGHYFDFVEKFYLDDSISQYSVQNISQSISNLERLGLIKITDESLGDEENVRNSTPIKRYFESLENDSIQLTIIGHRMDFTPYGKDFISVCVEERS